MSAAPDAQRPQKGPARRRVLLAGNPNCGKTSLFNHLTGSNQRVGNYPGVTVERRSGKLLLNGERFEVVDLPGTYSLASYTPEERVASHEIIDRGGEVVVVVADSTNLTRSLVLLAQVMHVGCRTVLALNMSDEAHAAGQQLDTDRMAQLIGCPVVETTGHRGGGVKDLSAAIAKVAERPQPASRLVLGTLLDEALDTLTPFVAAALPQYAAPAWGASRLLASEAPFLERLQHAGPAGERAIATAQRLRTYLKQETGLDAQTYTTECYFGFVDGLIREVTVTRARGDARAFSDRLDEVLAHRTWGLPVFAIVMYAVFWVTFTLGEAPMGWLETGFAALADAISSLWPAGSASWLRSLIVDGIIGGVGGVAVFVPNIVLLFGGLALLEDSGYMARAAFLMDRVMERFGLHGKSFLPMMTGFGCTVPAIMATRTLENERDRLTTMMVLPLMSCGARLPIWMLLIPAFFPPALRAPALFLIYGIGVVLALSLAWVLRKTLLHGAEAPFVMELPPYRMPTLKGVLMKIMERGYLYLKKAGTVILAISIVMWFLAAWPRPSTYEVDVRVATGKVALSEDALAKAHSAEDLRYSLAGRIGGLLEPVMRPLGFDWKLSTAMVGAFAAKEVFVAQLGVVYSLGETTEEDQGLREQVREDYPPLVGVSLILFLLISAPCMATIAVTRRESGSWRWAMFQLVGLTTVAWVIGAAVYQIGGLFISS